MSAAAEDKDTHWGRCDGAEWRPDGTCSNCGSARPSLALMLIRNGAELEPTDKNYKIYVAGLKNPGGKCYLNHFSESQAIELVMLWVNGQIKFAYPGTFYSGLCFSRYADAIEKALGERFKNQKKKP